MTAVEPIKEMSKLFSKPEPRKSRPGLYVQHFQATNHQNSNNNNNQGNHSGNNASDAQASAEQAGKLTTVFHHPEELANVPNLKDVFWVFSVYDINFSEIEADLAPLLPAQSPLHVAAKNDSLNHVLELFIDVKMNLEKRDKRGRTPLLKAANFCAIENVQLLIKRGANLDAVDSWGNSVFHLLMKSKPLLPFSTAGSPSSSPLSPRASTSSPLSPRAAPTDTSAQSSKMLHVCKMLLDSGADINIVNNLEESCLDLMARKSKKNYACRNEVVQFLRSNGAKQGKDLIPQPSKGKGKIRGFLGL